MESEQPSTRGYQTRRIALEICCHATNQSVPLVLRPKCFAARGRASCLPPPPTPANKLCYPGSLPLLSVSSPHVKRRLLQRVDCTTERSSKSTATILGDVTVIQPGRASTTVAKPQGKKRRSDLHTREESSPIKKAAFKKTLFHNDRNACADFRSSPES